MDAAQWSDLVVRKVLFNHLVGQHMGVVSHLFHLRLHADAIGQAVFIRPRCGRRRECEMDGLDDHFIQPWLAGVRHAEMDGRVLSEGGSGQSKQLGVV